MTSAVEGDNAVAVGGEEGHLVFRIVAVEGPAVAEDNGRSDGEGPVFVVDLVGVWGCYEWHRGWAATECEILTG